MDNITVNSSFINQVAGLANVVDQMLVKKAEDASANIRSSAAAVDALIKKGYADPRMRDKLVNGMANNPAEAMQIIVKIAEKLPDPDSIKPIGKSASDRSENSNSGKRESDLVWDRAFGF